MMAVSMRRKNKCAWLASQHSSGRCRRQRAFTLLEVLVALAIIGLVLPPLLINAAERVKGLSVMQEKIIANLVAQNRLAIYRLNSDLAGKRPPRREDGNELMAGRDWYWEAQTQPTEIEGYFRIDIRVGTERELLDPRARLSAYLGVEQ
jgi:general secretion pathway protein I